MFFDKTERGMSMERCSRCGKDIPKPDGGITTGYGTDAQGNKHCYACCAELDREFMDSHDRMTLYLTFDEAKAKAGGFVPSPGVHCCNHGWTVGNWPGSLKFDAVVRKGRHNIAGTRYDAWFTDHKGRKWWGVRYGDNTELVHCRKLKAS